MAGGETVPPDVRLLLGAAAAEWCARERGIRLLHIKGFAAGSLLGDREYGDVDVWVDPSKERPYLESLRSAGFELGYSRVQRGFRGHATDVLAHQYGVKIDVHVEFPGVTCEAQEAFEALWAAREEAHVAGHGVSQPGRVDNALIVALHAARTPLGSRAAQEGQRAWDALRRDERMRFRDRGAQFGAESVLGLTLEDFSGEVEDRDAEYFSTIRGPHSRVRLWGARIRRERTLTAKLSLLLGAAAPPQHDGGPPLPLRDWLGRARWTLRTLVRELGERRRRGL